ncbi:MAG: LuxR family transcriptional regulator [Gordonibacter sp.]|nr:LuxR family transcriptional regulator [Gordonibacter sp.]
MAKTRMMEKREKSLASVIARFVPMRRFGWAFLLAWVFCVFYTEVVDGYVGRSSEWFGFSGLLEQLFFSGLPVLMSVLTLIAIVGAERTFGSPADHVMLLRVAPVATAVSTPLLFWAPPNADAMVMLFVLGSLLTGFGSGVMWVMWGEYFARISQEDVEFLSPLSAIIAALLVLLVSSMSGWVALVFVTVLPLLSGLCFALSWKEVKQCGASVEHAGLAEQKAYTTAHNRAKNSLSVVLVSMGRVALGLIVACLFVCLEGTFWLSPDVHAMAFQLVMLVSIAFMAIVSFFSTIGPHRISIPFLYRWMCPALVLGFVALIVFSPDAGSYIAYVISIAARFAFCVITQMFFSNYASSGKATAVQSFGLGWIFVHLGDFLGVITMIIVKRFMAEGAISLDQVAAVSIAVLVVVTMFVLNRKSFSLDGRVGDVVVGVNQTRGCANTWAKEFVTESAEEGSTAADSEEDILGARIRELAVERGLTPRETEVFDLLARGRSIPYVRDALFISKETAATHAKHIYVKLEVHSRQELIDLVH